jgi:hypothetical protein
MALDQVDAQRLDDACYSIVKRWQKRSPPLPADLIEEIEAGKAAERRSMPIETLDLSLGPFVRLDDMAYAMGLSHLSELVNLTDAQRRQCCQNYDSAVAAGSVTMHKTLPMVV